MQPWRTAWPLNATYGSRTALLLSAAACAWMAALLGNLLGGSIAPEPVGARQNSRPAQPNPPVVHERLGVQRLDSLDAPAGRREAIE